MAATSKEEEEELEDNGEEVEREGPVAEEVKGVETEGGGGSDGGGVMWGGRPGRRVEGRGSTPGRGG